LRIGAVVPDSDSTYTVRPHAALTELEYVSVLFFDTPVVIARDTPSGDKEQTTRTRQDPSGAGARKRHAKVKTR